MQTVLDFVLLVIGFVFLLKGADFLVEGAVGIAKRFHIPTLVIGMTIVAFGTSAPEAAVSISAAMAGKNDISVANVLGSNIFNLLVVGGISAIIRTIPIKRVAMNRDYPFHLVITAVLLFLICDVALGGQNMNLLSRADGIVLLLLMGVYMYINITDGIRNKEEEDENEEIKPVWKSILFFLGGLAGVVIGGDMVVDAATAVAKTLGVSDMVIGLTVVAIGTSLPELVTSAVACKKGEADIAWGNIIGSNVFNILFILGFSALIKPLAVDVASIYDTLILLVVSCLVYLGVAGRKELRKPLGIAMIIAYVAYTAYILVR